MKTVLITGVNRGLGKALLDELVMKGYYVFGIVRNPEEYQKLLVEKHDNVEYILTDISKDTCTHEISLKTKNHKVDLIINNAGIGGNGNKLENLNTEELMTMFSVHCLGVIRVLKAFSNALSQSNALTVLNINSRLGSITRQANGSYKHLTSTSYSYRIAKSAQNMLTNCLKLEFENAHFVSLMPGKLLTELSSKDADTLPSESAQKIIELWENGKLINGDGILEINENYIEW